MRDHRSVHLVGMATMAASLLIFGVFLLLYVNLNSWLRGWGQQLTMSVYLTDETSETQRESIAAAIREFPGAEIERYISKQQAFTELEGALGPRAELLKGLSKNPLPASFEVVFGAGRVQSRDPAGLRSLLEGMEGVDEVQYSQDWLHRFAGFMNLFRVIGFGIGGLLCVGILFIVSNTIRLTIYARREEIEILKLVGATDWFVRMPFLIEGAIQGVLGGMVAVAALYSGYSLVSTQEMRFLDLAVLQFVFIPQAYVLALLLLSVTLALLGSLIAVGHFFDL